MTSNGTSRTRIEFFSNFMSSFELIIKKKHQTILEKILRSDLDFNF